MFWLNFKCFCVMIFQHIHVCVLYHIHNGAQTTKSRLDRLLFPSFAGLQVSKATPGMSFSVRTMAVEFEVAFVILQFCIRAIRIIMVVQP